MKYIIRLFVIFSTLFLIACGGGGSVEIPPERQASSISGASIDGIIKSAEINVYSFDDGKKGELLTSGSIDDQGNFNLSIKEKSQIILVEAKDGIYKELATGEYIEMQEDQIISALAYYHTEKPLVLSLSPLVDLAATHIVYQMNSKKDFASSKSSTQQMLQELFAIDVFAATADQTSNKQSKVETLDNFTNHKLFVSALSSLSHWFAQKKQANVQADINSLTLIRVMKNDMAADGILNGQGLDENGELAALSIGGTELDADVYRMGIAQHLLAFSNSTFNNTGVTSENLISLAEKIATTPHQVFGGEAKASPLLAPEVEFQYTASQHNTDRSKLFVGVDSVTDIASIKLDINGELHSTFPSISEVTFEIDSNSYANGEYELGLTVIDLLGNETRVVHPVVFDNIYPNRVSGYAFNGLLSNATVSIYSLMDGEKGEFIASGKTNINGFFDINVKVNSQLFYIEASGGSYEEPITQQRLGLQSQQSISTIVYYESGESLNIQVSPLTYLATSLIQYQMRDGEDFVTSKEAVEEIFQELFNLAVFSPRHILLINQSIDSSDDVPVADAMHDILLGALASFSSWIAEENGHQNKNTYNLAALAAIMAKDIAADGRLDGMGLDESDQPVQLALNSVSLDANLYRMGLASHAMVYLKSDQNRSGYSDGELQAFAKGFSEKEHPLFGDLAVSPVSTLSPFVAHNYPDTFSVEGDFHLDLDVRDFADIEKITLFLDDEEIKQVDVQSLAALQLNTNSYQDGEHTFRVEAVDIFGNETTLMIPVIFDNVSLTIDSPFITNESTAEIYGSYAGPDVTSITFNEEAMSFENGAWSGTIDLVPGNNPVLIKIGYADYHEELPINLILDQTPPTIDTAGKHSSARFVSLDSSLFFSDLDDENLIAPIYFESNNLELGGITVTRDDLTNNEIPFFGLTVSDLLDGEAQTPLDDLTVKLSYFKNNVQQGDVKALSAINGEFLIPLVSEYLEPNWFRTISSDTHTITVSVMDIAGNVEAYDFIFQADIYVPKLIMDSIVELNHSMFSDIAFADRGELNGKSFDSTEYQFTNTTGKPFYIKLIDYIDTHEVINTVEEKVRKHKVNTSVITHWQSSQILNPSNTDSCLNASPTPVPITQIYNYGEDIEGGWELLTVPEEYSGNEFYIEVESLEEELENLLAQTPPYNPAWSFSGDESYNHEMDTLPNGNILSFDYDYVLRLNALEPASVKNWKIIDPNNDNMVVANCPQDVSYFQEYLEYNYSTAEGYPKNESSFLEELPITFSTESLAVFNIDTGLLITKNEDDWYRIPAGHRITIKKAVRMPDMINFDDPAVLFVDEEFSSYDALSHDKHISWSINKSIDIETIFDAGQEIIESNSLRSQRVGDGYSVYEVSRP